MPARSAHRGWTRPGHGWRSAMYTLAIAALALTAVATAIGAVVAAVEWRQSVDTQAHGIHLRALVVSTSEVVHQTKSGSYRTTDLVVGYGRDIGGVTDGTLHLDRDDRSLHAGSTIDAVVQRSDPSHVEERGHQLTTVVAPVVIGIISVLATGAAIALRRLPKEIRPHAGRPAGRRPSGRRGRAGRQRGRARPGR